MRRIKLTTTDLLSLGTTITLGHTLGTIQSTEGGKLPTLSGVSVVNNVIGLDKSEFISKGMITSILNDKFITFTEAPAGANSFLFCAPAGVHENTVDYYLDGLSVKWDTKVLESLLTVSDTAGFVYSPVSPDDNIKIIYHKLSATDISNMYLDIVDTPSRLLFITSSGVQVADTDYYIDGSFVKWDGKVLENIFIENDIVGVVLDTGLTEISYLDTVVLSGTDISNKYVQISKSNRTADNMVIIAPSGPLRFDIDFYVDNDFIKWDGKTLENFMLAGDVLGIIYKD